MAKPIVGSNNKLARIEIVLPLDENGDWAFDENGDPVKGRTPLSFTVPRLDCVPPDTFKELNAAVKAVDDLKDEEGEPLSTRDKSRKIILAMLQPFVSADALAVVDKLQLFELEQIAERIQHGSTVSVGELLASTDS